MQILRWTERDVTGQDGTVRDQTGQDAIGRYWTRQDRTRQDRNRQETKGTRQDVVVTLKLWCCVCVFVTPKREFCDGLSVM